MHKNIPFEFQSLNFTEKCGVQEWDRCQIFSILGGLMDILKNIF